MLSVIIDLTNEQIRELEPLFIEVGAAARLTSKTKKEQRFAVLGQAWSPDDTEMGDKAGCAKFYLLTTEQFKVVNRAIVKALKMEVEHDDDGSSDIT